MENTGEFASDTAPAEQVADQPNAGLTVSQQWGNTPDAEQIPQEDAPQPPEFQFELPSGSRYRSQEDLVRGATEKDFTIERMKAQLAELQSQSRLPAQPQVDPQQQANAAIEQLQREWETELRNDPMFEGSTPEAIAAEARIQARVSYRNEQMLNQTIQKQFEQRNQQSEWRDFVEENRADLYNEIGKRVYDDAEARGQRFQTPQDHLNATHAEMYRLSRNGQQPPMPQAGGTQAVQGAMQTQQRPIFGYMNSSGPPAQNALPERVQKAVEYGMQKGFSGAELESIKQRAIENESRFRR